MQIIKRGVIPAERKWRGNCFHCSSIMEAKQSELTIQSNQRDGEWATTKCPVCGSPMNFYPKEEQYAF